MNTLPQISTLPLFSVLDEKLISLLKNLDAKDWDKKTLAPLWTIKDIAGHLLDGNLRTLSMLRDGYFGEKPENINSYQDLVGFLNDLNHHWVRAMKRISPNMLVQLLESSGKEYTAYLHSLNLEEKATFSVAWAGEEESKNWFHIAREYTEKWHHQQQIRFALELTDELYAPTLYHPYLQTSMRALPHHYRNTEGKENDTIHFKIVGEAGGDWYLIHNSTHWQLQHITPYLPLTKVEIPQEIAWRIFTKGIPKQEALKQSTITGNLPLGEKFFEMLAVMA
jgi:hypothetical protein